MRFLILTVICISIHSCGEIKYYSTQPLKQGRHGESWFSEIQLYPDSTFAEYSYYRDPRSNTNFGEVYTGKFEIVGDTLNTYVNSSTGIFDSFLIKGNKLVKPDYEKDSTVLFQNVYKKKKSKEFREVELKDSIEWNELSSEFAKTGSWKGFIGLNEKKSGVKN